MPSYRCLAAFVALFGAGAVASAQISFLPAASEPLQGPEPDWIASGDFDNDGDRDLAISTGQLTGISGPDRIEILLNNGEGDFTPGQVIFVGTNVSAAAVVAANLDGDFDIDLAISLQDIGVVQSWRNSGGTFSFLSSIQTGGTEPRHMAGGDVDNDGDIDLVTSNRGSNNLRIVLNNGSGVLSLGALLGVGIEPRHVVVANLNGDLLNDIAVAVHDSARVDVLVGIGGGSFSAVQSTPMPFSEHPSGMAAADLDLDGDIDLATTIENNGAGYVVALGNAGNASFAATPFVSSGLNPDAVVVADFDSDGYLDLATNDEGSNVVSVLTGNGSMQFAVGVTFAVGTHPSSLVAADFDANGWPDIATANRDSNEVSVLINNTPAGPLVYCTAGTSFGACVGSITANANPRVNGSTPCIVTVANVDAQRSAIMFYGLQGLIQPWCAGGNSELCVKPPMQRGLIQTTGGTAGTCTGSFSLDWNAFQNNNPGLLGQPWTAGEKAFLQGWYRDPGSCKNTQLSNGIQLTHLP